MSFSCGFICFQQVEAVLAVGCDPCGQQSDQGVTRDPQVSRTSPKPGQEAPAGLDSGSAWV